MKKKESEDSSRQTISGDAAFHESTRCLTCYNPPCTDGCPAGIPVGDFIRRIRWKDWEGAAELILEANPFGTVCGFVCPEDILCEKECIRKKLDFPVRIRELQKYVTLLYAQKYRYNVSEKTIREPVAILGGGPAGVSCAFELARRGISVDMYEKRAKAGGVAFSSLPSFRLPNEALQFDLERVFHLNINHIQKDLSTMSQSDFDHYKGIFIGLGLDKVPDLHIAGEELPNVIESIEFLEQLKGSGSSEKTLEEKYHTICIIGGGNTAMDCALTARKNYPDSRVIISYRRRMEEMPAWDSEKEKCFKAGVDFLLQTQPVKIHGENKVQSITLRRTVPGKPDATGRRRPVEVKDSEFQLPCDLVIKALGQKGPCIVPELFPEVEVDNNCFIQYNENQQTSARNIWAGGDCCNKGKTVVEAVGEGKKAAQDMYRKIREDTHE